MALARVAAEDRRSRRWDARAHGTVTSWPLVLVVAALVLLGGCSDAPSSGSQRPSGSSGPTPALGGPPVARATPPDHAMDQLERPVAVRLARQVARQGLTLEYLDCPRWDGTVPSRMSCRAYVDGLRTGVEVVFTRAVQGKAVGFDARLARGVIATRNLERTLRRRGLGLGRLR